jgi:hypothetical protein
MSGVTLVTAQTWAQKPTPADPSGLALTAWYRDYTNPAWGGTASAGTSGSGNNDLTDPGTEPAQGTALNAHGTANFNGTDDYFTAEGTLDRYVNGLSLSGWALIKPDTVGVNQSIWGDTAVGECLLEITSGGSARLRLHASGASVTRAIGATVWSLVTFRYSGTNVQIGVNEVPGSAGGASTSAYSTTLTPLTGIVLVSDDGGAGTWFDGHMAEFGITDTVMSDQNFVDLKSYINTRYALSL